jgi:hypothetical protein
MHLQLNSFVPLGEDLCATSWLLFFYHQGTQSETQSDTK